MKKRDRSGKYAGSNLENSVKIPKFPKIKEFSNIVRPQKFPKLGPEERCINVNPILDWKQRRNER